MLGKLANFSICPIPDKVSLKRYCQGCANQASCLRREEGKYFWKGGGRDFPGSSTSSPSRGGVEPAFFFHLGISSPSGSTSAPTQENLSGANIAPLLLFQKTLEIYSVEVNGTKDVNQTDQGDDKTFKEMKNKDSEPNKGHEKEELKKELDLVSPLRAKGPAAPCH